MITLVMPSHTGGADSLTLQVSPTVSSGVIKLRAVAVLSRVPGADVSRWSIDGAVAGSGSWRQQRRLQDGRIIWQTEIQTTVEPGDHVVTVSFRGMTDSARITAGGGGAGGELDMILGFAGSAEADFYDGLESGGSLAAPNEEITVSGSGLKYVLAAVSYRSINADEYTKANFYITASTSPLPNQAEFGALYVGSSIFFRLNNCPANVFSIYATVYVGGEHIATNTIALTVT